MFRYPKKNLIRVIRMENKQNYLEKSYLIRYVGFHVRSIIFRQFFDHPRNDYPVFDNS